ncbi:MAG TPA: hypothetical protein VGQ35_15065 [Dongiaceae bacterium]|nr:hypothetical protein [Dongiaceae bacterium]
MIVNRISIRFLGGIMSAENETAPHYWSLANNVSVFAVVQMIAYLMALGASKSEIRDGVAAIRCPIEIVIVVATAGYCVVVWYFSRCHWTLLGATGTELSRMLRWTAIFRLVVIIAAGVGGFGVTHVIQVAGH